MTDESDIPQQPRTLTEAQYRARSRRSVLTGIGGAAAAGLGWRWINRRPLDDRIPDVLRTGHEVNESIWRTLFRDGSTAPTFDYNASSMMRVNGRHGLDEEIDVDIWELRVLAADGSELGVHNLSDLRGLAQQELVVEHKCVEGWSHVVAWGGPRFSDFMNAWYPDQIEHGYVGLATPDDRYRVGLEMDAMMHPQTLLALDLQREPLDSQHGAPVRLATPLKYGIKQIKRIGTVQFSDTRPEGDYWGTRGYDWYAAL